VNDPVELWNFYTALFETLGDVSFGAVVFDFDLATRDATRTIGGDSELKKEIPVYG